MDAVEYWSDESLSSVESPDSFATPMLIRSRKERRKRSLKVDKHVSTIRAAEYETARSDRIWNWQKSSNSRQERDKGLVDLPDEGLLLPSSLLLAEETRLDLGRVDGGT